MNHDNLKYGDPNDEDLRIMNQAHPLIDIDPLSLPMVPVPSNSLQELEKVISHSANPQLPMQIRRICDIDLVEPFRIILEERNIEFPEDEVEELVENLRPLILKLKYHFNRPRPFQVAKHNDVAFIYDDFASAMTPSYPSGHTLMAYVIAGYLSRIFPEYMEEIYTSAEMVAQSRLEAGVHFPSDNFYGMLLAEEIIKNLF